MRKLTNIRRLSKIGFKHKINLEDGLKKAYKVFVAQTYHKTNSICRAMVYHNADRLDVSLH